MIYEEEFFTPLDQEEGGVGTPEGPAEEPAEEKEKAEGEEEKEETE